MLRLRTTAGLSLLALIVGTAGTGWLSGQTAGWAGLPRMAAQPRHAPRHAPAVAQRAARRAAVPVAVRRPVPDSGVAQAVADEAAPPPVLTPLSTPADPQTPYADLRGHLDGRVVLRIAVDGAGRVRHAAVGSSSGDPVLDAHALATVGRWRFAVPADRPDGFSGDLPMRFDSGERLAHAP
ncbi:hypothetical protein ASG87_12620 [Frateuria sp. Soil773]|uniref:energy transducer TonB family protein n=1 Tax=Frateuria sp. Soil773 TaxID=1736407 RepID=UPI0006FCE715|nr:energy transducer TonB [Frateuria sp. Soil773]KRF00534.1 hypothetical protein ASG87_12620 [Frateuria sp. Soil773]